MRRDAVRGPRVAATVRGQITDVGSLEHVGMRLKLVRAEGGPFLWVGNGSWVMATFGGRAALRKLAEAIRLECGDLSPVRRGKKRGDKSPQSKAEDASGGH